MCGQLRKLRAKGSYRSFVSASGRLSLFIMCKSYAGDKMFKGTASEIPLFVPCGYEASETAKIMLPL